MISIFTCSYNKTNYVCDSIQSVINQTYQDWELWILENSSFEFIKDKIKNFIGEQNKEIKAKIIYQNINVDEKQRKEIYIESFLKNNYFEKANGNKIMVLSDDDILFPNCLKAHAEHADRKITYHSVQVRKETTNWTGCFENKIIYDGVGLNYPGCNIDGGAICFEKELLKHLPQPWFPVDWKQAATSDAEFMNKLVKLDKFYPVADKNPLSLKRMTPLSIHQKG